MESDHDDDISGIQASDTNNSNQQVERSELNDWTDANKIKKEQGSITVQLVDMPLGNWWLQVTYPGAVIKKTAESTETTFLSIFAEQAISIITRIDFVSVDYELSSSDKPSEYTRN